MRGKDLVIVSSIDWDEKWQGPQEIAKRFADRSNRVLYVENPGVRTPKSTDARRILQRAKNIIRGAFASDSRVEEDVTICSPIALPPFGSRSRKRVNRLLIRISVGRVIRKMRLKDPTIIVCLPTDVAMSIADLASSKRSVLIYYAISDLLAMTDHPDEMEEVERRFLQRADLVFTTYLPLVERFGISDVPVHHLPYGVDTKRFSIDGPKRRDGLDDTVIGYVGGISQHLDTGLINSLAAAHPEWNIVLIGPREAGGEGLEDAPNIHVLGQLPHSALPGWVRGFDVCIIPYRHSPYMDTVYPVKLNEYLAAGRPVVSVELPSLTADEEEGVLWLAKPEPAAFLGQIEKALRVADDEALVRRRSDLARVHDWDRRIERIEDLIEGVQAVRGLTAPST